MSIFQEFGGRSSYYTANELDRLQNPEKYNYDQAQYDAFAAQAQKKADSRQAALEASQDAIPYSYVGRGTGATNPAFSFAGYSGQTSGGTSGLSGFGGLAGLFGGGSTAETTGSTTSGGGGGGGGGGPRDDQGNVQHMQEGGMIQSPYANPMRVGLYDQLDQKSSAIGGLFQQLHQQMGQMQSPPLGQQGELTVLIGPNMGPPVPREMQSPPLGQQMGQMQQQMGQMQSQPLKIYQNYLMQTYAQPEMQAEQQKVDHFLDLVDQAERAHFGAEESFGFGGGPMAQQYQQRQRLRGGPRNSSGMPDSGIASLPPAF